MVSFSTSTVVGSAPSREDLAAALPESERGSTAVYLRHFSHPYAQAWMEAVRRIAPGIQVPQIVELHKRFDLKSVRHLVDARIPLEYALA